MTIDHGGWYTPVSKTEYTGPEPFTDVQGNGSEEFARRRLQRRTADPEICCIVAVSRDGSVSTWADIATEEQHRWIKRRLLDATRVMRTALKGRL